MIPKEIISTLNFKFLNTTPFAVLNDEDTAILVGDLYECTKYISTYKGFGEPHLRIVRLTSSTLEAKQCFITLLGPIAQVVRAAHS